MIVLSLHTTTPGNRRQHWAVEAKRAKTERTMARLSAKAANLPPFPVRVSLCRVGPRRADRHNLPGMLKHVIDGIADAYGVDDGDERWEFVFSQRIDKNHSVEITIEEIKK